VRCRVLLDRLLPVSLRQSFSKAYSTVRDPDVFRPLPSASIKERAPYPPVQHQSPRTRLLRSSSSNKIVFSIDVRSFQHQLSERQDQLRLLSPSPPANHQHCNHHHPGLNSPKALLAELVLDPAHEENKKIHYRKQTYNPTKVTSTLNQHHIHHYSSIQPLPCSNPSHHHCRVQVSASVSGQPFHHLGTSLIPQAMPQHQQHRPCPAATLTNSHRAPSSPRAQHHPASQPRPVSGHSSCGTTSPA
jgi:hypothetical protein